MEKIRDLKNQIEELKLQLSEARETLQAIQTGEVDALVIQGPSGDQVYTIQGADIVYRIAIETINEGAITVSPEGVILYANHYFAQMMRADLNRLVGASLFDFISPGSRDMVVAALTQGSTHAEVSFQASDGTQVPTHFATTTLQLDNPMFCAVVTDLTHQKRSDDIIKTGNLIQSVMKQSPNAMLIFDTAGIIIFASNIAYQLFEGDVLGQPIESMLAHLYCSGKAVRLTDIQNGAIKDDMIVYAEKNGKRTHLLLRYGRLEGDTVNKGSLIILTNITQLKLVEAELKESEEHFKVAIRNAAIVLAQYDLGLRYVWIYNPHPDFEPASVIGKRDDELEDSEGARRLMKVKQRVIDSGVGAREEISFDRSDGIKVYELILDPLTDSSGTIVGGTTSALDITERYKAEKALIEAKNELEVRVEERTLELALANEQLRQYSYRITQIQEEERKRIAYELGEELAQTLAVIKLEADLMAGRVNSSITNLDSHVARIGEMMGDVVHHATNFSNELRPTVLGSLGLPDALGELIKEMNSNEALEIVLQTNGAQRRLHDEIETALFRIAQEAINNSIRHSGATKAKVNLGFLKTRIKLTIMDDGKGFDTERTPEPALQGVFGLIGMKERTHQIGGELKIKSELGKGTVITVTCPYN